jgi:undecaprenyl diphosphate synthase
MVSSHQRTSKRENGRRSTSRPGIRPPSSGTTWCYFITFLAAAISVDLIMLPITCAFVPNAWRGGNTIPCLPHDRLAPTTNMESKTARSSQQRIFSQRRPTILTAHHSVMDEEDSKSDTTRSTTSTSTNDHDIHDIPQHVAFICDGNSRWAQQYNLSTSQGHWKGADRLTDLFEYLREDGISYCTLYAFSTENWRRPPQEIQEIFRVVEQTARNLVPRLLQESSPIHLRILGDLDDDRIPLGLRTILQELQKLTDKQSVKRNDKLRKQRNDGTKHKTEPLTVCLAINYGGRQDILQASRKMAAAVVAGELSAEEMSEDTMSSYLSTAGIPDPDIIVRTSGEHRLSNFLLWNAAYSELYVTDVLWPDFDIHCWKEALKWYQQRSRRFGSRSGKVDTASITSAKSANTKIQK